MRIVNIKPKRLLFLIPFAAVVVVGLAVVMAGCRVTTQLRDSNESMPQRLAFTYC
jgi:hypothetical protein